MGATEFETYVAHPDGDEPQTMAEAYRRAVENAHYEYGHDPYNGTISTTEGCFAAASEPLTREQADDFVRSYWDWKQDESKPNPLGGGRIEKWGPAAGIPIKASDGRSAGWLFFGLAAM